MQPFPKQQTVRQTCQHIMTVLMRKFQSAFGNCSLERVADGLLMCIAPAQEDRSHHHDGKTGPTENPPSAPPGRPHAEPESRCNAAPTAERAASLTLEPVSSGRDRGEVQLAIGRLPPRLEEWQKAVAKQNIP